PAAPVKAAPPKPIAKPAAPMAKAAAASAGQSRSGANPAGGLIQRDLDSAAPVINTSESATEAFSVSAPPTPSAPMSSAATVEPEYEAPQISVDPMMDEGRQAGAGASRSFSEIDELPPLKEIYTPPPAPRPVDEPAPSEAAPATVFQGAPAEKPKVQPREGARKAVTEIKKTPPKLFMVSIASALGIVLLIVAAIAWHIHSENADDDTTPVQPPPAAATTAAAQPNQPGNTSGAPASDTGQTTLQVAP